jgi:hypothetical protein
MHKIQENVQNEFIRDRERERERESDRKKIRIYIYHNCNTQSNLMFPSEPSTKLS